MRIAIFTDTYRPQINGVVTSVDSFVHELRRKGHKVFIFAPSDPKAKPEKYIYRVPSIKYYGYEGYRIGLPLKLLKNFPIEKFKPDVIHINSPFPIGMLGLKIARKYKIPVVATFHTMYPDYIHYMIKPGILLKVGLLKSMFRGIAWGYIRWFHNKCDTIIAPTLTIKKLLARNGVKKRIVVIPTGTHVRKHNANKRKLRKKYGFKDEKIILHVGRVTKEKSIDFIIRSLKPLLAGNYKLVILSDGPNKKNLEKMVQDEKVENVRFTGFVPEKEMLDYYTMADVYVMASATETQGIVLMDAAALGIPSVVLDVPVISDFVRENKIGIVANKSNFASKVKYVAEKKPSFAAGFKKVRHDYSIEKCVADLLRVYHSQ